jgi:protein involved in polysaccharide export with SLBB domain
MRLHHFTILVIVALAGCAGSSAAVPAASMPPGPSLDGLQPGDVVQLNIWREPDLSGEFQVDQSGRVVLPKIGPVSVQGRPVAEVEDSIRSAFDRYLRNPSIDVVMLRRINILGQVGQPGLYPVDPTMTVADAIALAGGMLPDARQDEIELLRGEHRLTTQITERTRITDLGLRSGDQLYVPERSWMARNSGLVATLAATVISGTISLIIAFSR